MINQKLNSNKKFYNCYSPRLFSYLTKHGFVPTAMNYHDKTKVKFFVYKMTDELSLALSLYKVGDAKS